MWGQHAQRTTALRAAAGLHVGNKQHVCSVMTTSSTVWDRNGVSDGKIIFSLCIEEGGNTAHRFLSGEEENQEALAAEYRAHHEDKPKDQDKTTASALIIKELLGEKHYI